MGRFGCFCGPSDGRGGGSRLMRIPGQSGRHADAFGPNRKPGRPINFSEFPATLLVNRSGQYEGCSALKLWSQESQVNKKPTCRSRLTLWSQSDVLLSIYLSMSHQQRMDSQMGNEGRPLRQSFFPRLYWKTGEAYPTSRVHFSQAVTRWKLSHPPQTRGQKRTAKYGWWPDGISVRMPADPRCVVLAEIRWSITVWDLLILPSGFLMIGLN